MVRERAHDIRWMTGMVRTSDSEFLCTGLAKRDPSGLWQNPEGLYSLGFLTPAQLAELAIIAGRIGDEIWKHKRWIMEQVRFVPMRFFPWIASPYYQRAADPGKFWPFFLRTLPEDEYLTEIHRQVASRQEGLERGMERTWEEIYEAGSDLIDLDFVRFVARADINKIASPDFKDRVIDLAQGEIRIYLANDDCVKRMVKEEVYSYDHTDWIRKFIDARNRQVMNRVIPEREWKPRYLNNTLALLGNLYVLKSAMEEKPGKVKVFLYDGNTAENGLPTLRGTLVSKKEANKAFASLMPRKATGAASSIVSIDHYFDRAQKELNDLNPTELTKMGDTISSYVKKIELFYIGLEKLRTEDVQNFGRGLRDLQQEYRAQRDYVEIINNLQDIVTNAYSS